MNSPAPISGDWHCGSNCQTYQSGTTGEALLLQPWSGYWAVLVGGWTNPSYLDPSYLEESACHCLSNWIIFSGFPGEKKHVWNTKNQLGPLQWVGVNEPVFGRAHFWGVWILREGFIFTSEWQQAQQQGQSQNLGAFFQSWKSDDWYVYPKGVVLFIGQK